MWLRQRKPPSPPVIDEAYRITPETADPSAVLKAAKEAGANALITAGTYAKGFTVDGITLYVEGEVNVQNGITLKNGVVAGYSGDRTADVLTITETAETTVNGGTLQNLTVNITGAAHNYLIHWQSGDFLVDNAILSASGNTKGCGLYAGGGTVGSKFRAVNSDVSFCNNVQEDGGSGIWANSDGNANAVFEFEGGSLKLNNNGLNGFLGQPGSWLGNSATTTFRFTNTDVEAMGNGSPTDGGNGDGFSYGYITLNSTDGKLHTFNVSNNDKNGLDGGINNADTLYLPENAVVYNNHADKAGDDIYSKELKEGKSIRFYAVGSDWVLDDCGHLIDGWYVDSDRDPMRTVIPSGGLPTVPPSSPRFTRASASM